MSEDDAFDEGFDEGAAFVVELAGGFEDEGAVFGGSAFVGAANRDVYYNQGLLRRTEVRSGGVWVTLMGYTYGADGNLDLENEPPWV